MSYKQIVMVGKAWMHFEPVEKSQSGLITQFVNALKSRVTVGYQDESGFHVGVKAAKTESRCPESW